MKFNTKTIHGGQRETDPAYGAVMPPIYQTSTFSQTAPGDHKGFVYARSGNPTRAILEGTLADVESGRHGMAFSSGLAATDTVLKLFAPGDEIIASADLYGGSYRLFTKIFERMGLVFHFVDFSVPTSVEKHINGQTKLLWIETPTNPMMTIIDIEAVSALAKKHSLLLAVDNTFASPYLQRPLELGADIVMHSATKYIGGHSDVVMGALVVRDDELAEKLYFIQRGSGGVSGPQDCFLALRGLKTLHVRMQRHCENAAAVARFLSGHPKVAQVFWPGLESHPGHGIAKRQMKDFGGMVSFAIKSDQMEDAFEFLKKVRVFTLAESLGGVESLASHPATMTHASIPKAEREKTGVTDGLIRLSVGIEDIDDLLSDLGQALDF